jgi:hypothetical protein
MFPIAPHSLSNNIWLWFNFHVFILEGDEGEEGHGWSAGKMEHDKGLYFGVRLLHSELPHVPKILAVGQSNGLF